jgi:hypothetical protein
VDAEEATGLPRCLTALIKAVIDFNASEGSEQRQYRYRLLLRTSAAWRYARLADDKDRPSSRRFSLLSASRRATSSTCV